MRHLACLSAVLCAAAAFAQLSSAQSNEVTAASTTASPVAYVYVSGTSKNSSTGEITAYTTNPDGALTPIPGSPFRDSVASMATTGSYLFAATRDGLYVNSYAVERDGALRYVTHTNLSKYNHGDCGISQGLWLDHTGATLYNLEYLQDCANSEYESFNIDKATGGLTLTGNPGNTSSAIYLPSGQLSFSAIGTATVQNGAESTVEVNQYAYSATCLSDKAWEIYGFQRQGDGSLKKLNIDPAFPAAKSGDGFCPMPLAAADPNYPFGHVAFAFQAKKDPPFGANDGPPQLATYEISLGTTGRLTTTSTYKNMPAVSTKTVDAMAMNGFGNLLAVGGSGGLEVFHFQGGLPITPYTGLLTKDPIVQISWDGDDHLYAISKTTGKLYVFTLTATSFAPAPGSPHSIGGAQNLVTHSFAPVIAPGTQYETNLFPTFGNTNPGLISMNSNGQIAIQLAGAPAHANYGVQFCQTFGGDHEPPCLDIGSVSTDAKGNASASMKFPKSGDWAGDFFLKSSNSTQEYQSGFAATSYQVFLARLVPMTTVNDGTLIAPAPKEPPQAPLAGGSVTWSNPALKFTLAGTVPDTGFGAVEGDYTWDDSNSYGLINSSNSPSASNSKGDITFFAYPDYSGGDMFEPSPSSDLGFIGGFSVP